MNELFIYNDDSVFKLKTLSNEELNEELNEEMNDNLNEIYYEKLNESDIENDNNENIKTKYKCFFTNILNIQKENKINREYNAWINTNYNDLQSAFYIISKKYFDNVKLNREITFKEFIYFCYFSK